MLQPWQLQDSTLWCFESSPVFFPQQRKLMGSSAQNSSGVHMCRRRVRFNGVPEKVPEKVWEALVHALRFNRVSEKVLEKVLEKVPLVQSQVRFNSAPEKVPQKVPEKVWETLVQSHIRFNRIPEKVLGEALVQSQVGINRVLEKVSKKVWETSVQIQVRFKGVPEKVPEGFGAEPGYWDNPQLPKGHCFQPMGCFSR